MRLPNCDMDRRVGFRPCRGTMAEALSRHKEGETNLDCIVLLNRMDDGSPITRATTV